MPTQQLDCAAAAGHLADAFGFDHPGYQRGAGFRLNRDFPCLLAADAEPTAGIERHILLCAQDDFAAGIPHYLSGINNARIAQRRAVNADLPTLRKDLTEVDGGVVARRQFHPHPRRAGVKDLHRLTGGQNHVALRAVDDAAVGDV